MTSPKKYQPIMVEKAKNSMQMATKALPKEPNASLKAIWARVVPVSPEESIPEVRITRAVTEQTQMVAMNTSKMPHIPCSAGSLVLEAAWAMAEVPMPASLVNTPRATP